jgi:hypothetical protein
MNKALKISAYVLGGASIVVLSNQIVKYLNDGVGFLTTKRHMGKYVAKSNKGLNDPRDTKDEIKEWLDTWKGYGDDYTKAWYKAVWKSEHGKDTPYFFVDNKRHKTKGGIAG